MYDHEAFEHAQRIREILLAHGSRRVEVSGSLRRGLSVVGDIDLIAIVDDEEATQIEFRDELSLRGAVVRQDVHMAYHGGGNLLRVWVDEIKTDIRFTSFEVFGATQLWLTGNRDFGRSLEARARERGWRFTPDGVFSAEGELAIPCSDERRVLEAIAGCWIPPELRSAALRIVSDVHKVPA